MAGAASGSKRSFAWLRVVLLNLALVMVGVGGYFLYFKNGRESSLTDSYMRSLDRVAERVELFSQNGRQIGSFLNCKGAEDTASTAMPSQSGASGRDEGGQEPAGFCDEARNALAASPGFERVTLVFPADAGKDAEIDEHLRASLHGTVPVVLEESRLLYMPTDSDRKAAEGVDDLSDPVPDGVVVPVEDVLALPAATFPFDSLYLVDRDGRVIAQRELPDGPPQAHPVELIVPATERRSFTRLADLAQAIASTGSRRSDGAGSGSRGQGARAPPPQQEVTELFASQVRQVSLGDRLFRVFIQPIDLIAFQRAEVSDPPRGQGNTVTDSGPWSRLAVVGIVDERRFQRTALSVGYTPLAVLLGISILVIASLPLLRLFLTDRHMTVSRSFAWLVLGGCAVTLLVALFVVVLLSQQRWESRTLAAEVRVATEEVRERVRQQLERMGKLVENYRNLFPEEPPAVAEADDRRRRERQRCKDVANVVVASEGVDRRADEPAADQPSPLPFALALAADGNEILDYRASCRESDPAPLEAPDRAYARYWRDPPPDPVRYYFQRLISYLDGSRSFIVSTPWHADEGDETSPHVAVLASDMQELAMASATRQWPVGVRFALVTQSGQVAFHSYDELSVVENWLRETDSPTSLVGALQTGKAVTFRAQYHGAPITGYVTPVRLKHGTYAPEMWLIGYVPTADLDALRFYGAMTGLPMLLMVAAGWTAIFIIATALPGRRYDLVFPNAERAPVYRWVLLGAVAGSLVWIAGAWVAARSDLRLLERSPDLLLLGLLAQLAWLCSRPTGLFVPGEAHGRALKLYATGAIGIALALSGALATAFLERERLADVLLLLLQVVTLGGGWIPLAVWIGIRWSHTGSSLPRWPAGVVNAYLGMWLALIAALVLPTISSYVVLTSHWQEATRAQYQSTFCSLAGKLVQQNIDAQLSRLLEDDRRSNPWAKHLRDRLAEGRPEPCVGRPDASIANVPRDDGSAEPPEALRWFGRLEASLPSISASVGAARSRAEAAPSSALGAGAGDVLAAAVVIASVLLGIFVTLRAVARRLFGLNVVFATHLVEAPFSARASEDSRSVLYVESVRDTPVCIEPAEAGWRCETYHSLAQLERTSLAKGTLLILEGFEADIIDSERRMRLIQHLQRLVDEGQPMLVIAPVLPSYWLTQHEDLLRAGESLSIEDATRWQGLLEHFTVVTGCASHPRAAVYVAYDPRAYREHLKRLEEAGIHESVVDFIMSEIERCPRIRLFIASLSHELLHRIRQRHISGAAVDRALVEQVLARALEGEYQRFWSMSSPDEQAELISVAHGGFPNFADIQTIQSLMQRGLLVKTAGRICLPCETFRRFVLTRSQYRLKVLQARRSREGMWGAVLPSLIVVVGLILAFIVASSSRGADLVLAAMAGLVALVPALNALISLTSRRAGGAARVEGE